MRGERLERQVQHLLRPELVLELVLGGGEGLVEVAAAQLVVEREVGVLGVLEVLEVGEGAGRLELVVHVDLRGQRLDLVEDRRQLLVFGGDELHRLLGDVRIGGDARPRPARRRSAPSRAPGSAGRGTPGRNRGSGITFITSSTVTTCSTPGTFFAALVSIDLIWPCATVLRNSLACSMPGSRMVWVYSARPVTLSRPSRRGTERPTCEPTLALPGLRVVAISALRSVQGRANGAPDVDPHQFALVGHRAAHVGDELAFADARHRRPARSSLSSTRLAVEHGFRRFQPRRLVGRGAGDDARRLDRLAVALDARPRRRAPASRRPSRW